MACKKYKTIAEHLNRLIMNKRVIKRKAQELILTTHSNMALCHLKLGEHAECIRACDKALEVDPKNEKCLFRRGQSQMSMSGYEEAIKDFQAVLKLNLGNTAANQHVQTCRDHLKLINRKKNNCTQISLLKWLKAMKK